MKLLTRALPDLTAAIPVLQAVIERAAVGVENAAPVAAFEAAADTWFPQA